MRKILFAKENCCLTMQCLLNQMNRRIIKVAEVNTIYLVADRTDNTLDSNTMIVPRF